MQTSKPTTIDDYIAEFPSEVQKVMQQLRAVIRDLVPGAEEGISYAIPTFRVNGTYLVYFAGFKNHIGFYPTPSGTEVFKKDLAKYKTGKGSVQFPLNQPLPVALIKKIVKYRLKEISEKAKSKKVAGKKGA